MNRVIILAAGEGKRIGGEIPKQFIKVYDKPILAYTIEAFNSHSLIDSIIIVCSADYVPTVKSIVHEYKLNKVSDIVLGGKERYESCQSALCMCNNKDDILLFHDGARPLVNHRIITDCLNSMKQYDAVTVAVPTTDTIYMTNESSCITSIPTRSFMRNAQTPQCFRQHIIKEAYRLAINDSNFIPTDDCCVVNKYIPTCNIFIVNGESQNFKITYKEDLDLFKKIISVN